MYGNEDTILRMSDTNRMAIKTPLWANTSTPTVSRKTKVNNEKTKVTMNISCR